MILKSIVLTAFIVMLQFAFHVPDQQKFIFGDDKPFPQCHASSLLRLDDGTFMVAWFGGTREKHDDVGIWLSRGNPGDWSDPEEIAKIRPDAHWNPVLFQAPDQIIYLFFKVGKTIEKWETWYKTSKDQGQSWTEAKELVSGDQGGRGPVRNKPIVLPDGTWLAGASHEDDKSWNAFVDISADQGKTWQATDYLNLNRTNFEGKGIIQPTLWQSAPGKVHMLLRSTNGYIYRSDSDDSGKTWSEPVKTDLPNPNSSIDVTKLADGTLALAYNRDNKNWGSRGTLSVALSYDNGKTWPNLLDIEQGKSKEEFSYPAIISWGDSIAVSYTWNRKKIAFWKGKATQIPSSNLATKER
ncbi:MAG: sialidase family protein [Candidatus Cyclobacteriaceae bacterium M3_2C_046]